MQFAPGLEEYALLLAFQHIAAEYADFDVLVFDMPPTALSLRFFGSAGPLTGLDRGAA
jgi:arsenite/tail-anchored protein-transporting ATPase